MFPPQTSFIPTAVALARYIEAQGFGGNFPFWYLGTTPVKYLTGPVVPTLMIWLKNIFDLSYFETSYFIILTSFFLSAIGWGLLARQLSGDKKVGLWVGALMLVAPFHIFWNMAFGEVSAIAASALTPWVLFVFSSVRNFKKPFGQTLGEVRNDSVDLTYASARHKLERKYESISGLASSYFLKWLPSLNLRLVVNGQLSVVFPGILFAFLLLVNTTAVVPAMIGLAILGIISHKHWEDGIKSAAFMVIVGLILTLWWYTPTYWLTIATSSSIGGRSAFGAFIWILNMLRSLIPIILALAVVMWGFRPKGLYWKFAIGWTSVFALLTFLRFFANPAFWLDWTAWMGEVEVGLVLLMAKYVSSIKYFVLRDKLKIFAFCLLLVTSYFYAFQNRHLWLPRKSIADSVEYRISDWLNQTVNCQLSPIRQAQGDPEYIEGSTVNCPTVFLSGTTAFWLNSFYDIKQVRGGRDEVSVDNNWRKAAWEIRQGSDSDESLIWMKRLGVDYLVVHSENSGEFYHDFENIKKFDQIKSLKKVYEQEGDIIYYVND